MRQTYPDISAILFAKAQRRLALAALSWEEKVVIIEQMRILLPKGLWREATLANEKSPSQGDAARTASDPR
jgi:hypothetical protein